MPRGAHRHAAHRLDAAGDDDVVDAGHDALRGEVGGLLARSRSGGRWSPTGTCSGRPAPSHAQRPSGPACSPAWLTQPMMTSSTSAGSTLVAVHQRLEHLAEQLDGVQPDSAPPGLPFFGALPFAIGERTASTITALRVESVIGREC